MDGRLRLDALTTKQFMLYNTLVGTTTTPTPVIVNCVHCLLPLLPGHPRMGNPVAGGAGMLHPWCWRIVALTARPTHPTQVVCNG